jgi:superfamily I DNA/RNA helicase
MSLPQPIGRQKEVLYLPAHGHTVVLGTAGSGKTTMAVHRALYLANPRTDHHGRTLLLTFNRCLVAYLRSLAEVIPREVTVENYHKFARGYLKAQGRMRYNSICKPELQRRLCELVVASTLEQSDQPIFRRPVDFLLEEFRWLAQHGITTEHDYVQADRVGRAGTRITRSDRPGVFYLYKRYKELRKRYGKRYDWDDIAHTVLEAFEQDESQRLYRHIVIDEGQDFSPMMLRSLAVAVPQDGSLTFFGDMAQQIYGNKMSWRSAGLRVSQPWMFQENYRNTRQVAQLALAIAALPLFPDDPDLVEPKFPLADGPQPALVSFSSEEAEIGFLSNRASRLGETGTVAILFRDREQEARLPAQIKKKATRLHRDLATWPLKPGIFYGTYHSAKGLEFDAILLPFLSRRRLPHPPDVLAFGEDDATARDARLLYVAVTRARSTLILTYSGKQTSLLPGDEALYDRASR